MLCAPFECYIWNIDNDEGHAILIGTLYMLIQPIWACPNNTKPNSTQTISGERMIFPLRLEGWDSTTYIRFYRSFGSRAYLVVGLVYARWKGALEWS